MTTPNKTHKILTAIILACFSTPVHASIITVTPNATAIEMAETLAGPGVTVSNASFTGAPNSNGLFYSGYYSGFPMDSGIILSSGNVSDAEGPNDQSGAGTILGELGDDDLEELVDGSTHDAAVLEFDVLPTGDMLIVQFMFSSEEYSEYVGEFNDPMAIFVNGVNIARIPGTQTAVTVNNINRSVNSQYYINNNDDPSNPITPALDYQFDGTTVRLTASIPVTANSICHVKIAVADFADGALDSAVLVRAGSLSSIPMYQGFDLRVYNDSDENENGIILQPGTYLFEIAILNPFFGDLGLPINYTWGCYDAYNQYGGYYGMPPINPWNYVTINPLGDGSMASITIYEPGLYGLYVWVTCPEIPLIEEFTLFDIDIIP